MDFVDRLVNHDIWFTGRLLDRAAEVPTEALDRPMNRQWTWSGRSDNDASLRELLNEMVANKEMWTASLTGQVKPTASGDSVEDMKRRLDIAGKEFLSQVQNIRDREDWDSGFVDALCDPPESFTYGGMLAHVMTFSAFRRTMAMFALRDLGIDDIGIGDPIEWERTRMDSTLVLSG